MGWFKKFRKFLQKAAPIIAVVVAIVQPQFAAAIGKSLGFTGTAANAVGSAVISGSTTALGGGDVGDVVKSAVIGGLSAGAGELAQGAAGSAAKAAGYSDEVANIVGSGAGGLAGGTTEALGYGANLEDALKQGATVGLATGAMTGTVDFLNPKQQQPGVNVPRAGAPDVVQESLAFDTPGVGLRTGTPAASPDMAGGTGIIPPSDALLPASTRRDIASGRAMITAEGDVVPTMRTPEGRLIPAMANADGNLTPRSSTQTASYDLGDTSTKYGQTAMSTIDRPYVTSELGETGEAILREYIFPEFYQSASNLFNRDTGAPSSQTTQLGTETVGTPSSAALAQALRVSPGEPVFGSDDTGKQRRVWNVSSLKLKDEVGG
jgi:hypothetical protein